MNKIERASRKLTQILRHQIIFYNLQVDNRGFVKLDDILNLKLKELINITYDDICNIVESNEKKRLELETIDNIIYIRATQGHNNIVGSFINDEEALEKIEYPTNIKYIYHGTQHEHISSILNNGLKKMNRKHIHFVENINKKEQISGFRKKSDSIICVDINKCLSDGIVFYKSSNDVILTEGINGIIPNNYIVKIL